MIYSASPSSSLSSRATTSISLQNKGTVDKQEVTVRGHVPIDINMIGSERVRTFRFFWVHILEELAWTC